MAFIDIDKYYTQGYTTGPSTKYLETQLNESLLAHKNSVRGAVYGVGDAILVFFTAGVPFTMDVENRKVIASEYDATVWNIYISSAYQTGQYPIHASITGDIVLLETFSMACPQLKIGPQLVVPSYSIFNIKNDYKWNTLNGVYMSADDESYHDEILGYMGDNTSTFKNLLGALARGELENPEDPIYDVPQWMEMPMATLSKIDTINISPRGYNSNYPFYYTLFVSVVTGTDGSESGSFYVFQWTQEDLANGDTQTSSRIDGVDASYYIVTIVSTLKPIDDYMTDLSNGIDGWMEAYTLGVEGTGSSGGGPVGPSEPSGPIIPTIPDDHEKPETIIIPERIDNMNISFLRAVHEYAQTIHDVEVINAVITEQINSQYTLEFDLVNIEDAHYVEGEYLFFVDNQYFRVAKVSKTHGSSLSITVDCEHISYDLQDDRYPLPYAEDVEFETTPIQLLEYAMMNTPFRIVDTGGGLSPVYMKPTARTIRDLIFEMASFMEGEVIFDNFDVIIVYKRGMWGDVVAEFRLGSNLLSVTEQTEYENGVPRKSIEVDVIDLVSLDKFNGIHIEDIYEIQIGDLVRIEDPIISVDESLRIVHIERDPFKRMLPKIQVGNVMRSLTDYEKPEEEEEEAPTPTTDIMKYFSMFKIGDVDMTSYASDEKQNVMDNHFDDNDIEASGTYEVDLPESLTGVFAEVQPEYQGKYLYLFDAYFGNDGSSTMYKDLYEDNVNNYGAHEWTLPFERDDRDSFILVLSEKSLWEVDDAFDLEEAIICAFGVTIRVGGATEEEPSDNTGPKFVKCLPWGSYSEYTPTWNMMYNNDETPEEVEARSHNWHYMGFDFTMGNLDSDLYGRMRIPNNEVLMFNITPYVTLQAESDIKFLAMIVRDHIDPHEAFEQYYEPYNTPTMTTHKGHVGMNGIVFQSHLVVYEPTTPAPTMMPMSLSPATAPIQTYDTSDNDGYVLYMYMYAPTNMNDGYPMTTIGSLIGNITSLLYTDIQE